MNIVLIVVHYFLPTHQIETKFHEYVKAALVFQQTFLIATDFVRDLQTYNFPLITVTLWW